MMPEEFYVDFEITNPSPYKRTDFIEIDLDKLSVPNDLTSKNLALFEIKPDYPEREIPYQIDYPLGKNTSPRIISFLAVDVPPGDPDYLSAGIRYCLKKRKPSFPPFPSSNVIEYYLKNNPGIKELNWKPDQKYQGIKLCSDSIKVYYHLDKARSPSGFEFAGSVTSVEIPQLKEYHQFANDDILFPFSFLNSVNEDKLWGQITHLEFPPLPWNINKETRINLPPLEYSIEWAQAGPIRTIAVFKSSPFLIHYDLSPLIVGEQQKKDVKAHLFRSISIFPNSNPWFYIEELSIQGENPSFLSRFSPVYLSKLPPISLEFELCHLNHIPPYFSVWRNSMILRPGYGIASNSNTIDINIADDMITWSLSPRHIFQVVHMFFMERHNSCDYDLNPFQKIGHYGWYEKIYKPILAKDPAIRYPTVFQDDLSGY